MFLLCPPHFHFQPLQPPAGDIPEGIVAQSRPQSRDFPLSPAFKSLSQLSSLGEQRPLKVLDSLTPPIRLHCQHPSHPTFQALPGLVPRCQGWFSCPSLYAFDTFLMTVTTFYLPLTSTLCCHPGHTRHLAGAIPARGPPASFVLLQCNEKAGSLL